MHVEFFVQFCNSWLTLLCMLLLHVMEISVVYVDASYYNKISNSFLVILKNFQHNISDGGWVRCGIGGWGNIEVT